MSEFDQPLVLTTPHIKSDAVKDAQWLLAGHSRFPDLQTYKDGPLDGDYGSQSATATERAWYWIGAPAAKQRPVFTQELYEYLRPNKWRPLPVSWRKARDARIAAAAETPGRKALELAATFIGYHEGPRNNETIFGAWYGFNYVAWCAIFESYCFAHTGHPAYRYAAVEAVYYDARAGRNGLRIVTTPQAGDVMLYSHLGDRFAHTGFYDHRLNDRQFVDLSGNTSSADFANGGYVERHTREMSTVTAIVRVT
jgi:hypothetical protein